MKFTNKKYLEIDIDEDTEELFNNYYFENNSEKYDSLSNKKFILYQFLDL